LKKYKLLVSNETNLLSDDLMILDPAKLSSNDGNVDNFNMTETLEITNALCETKMRYNHKNFNNVGKNPVNDMDDNDDDDDDYNGKLDHDSVEYLHNLKQKRQDEADVVEQLSGIGNFPYREKVIGKCKHNENEVCLNLLNEEWLAGKFFFTFYV
jgi:hypothetical protein